MVSLKSLCSFLLWFVLFSASAFTISSSSSTTTSSADVISYEKLSDGEIEMLVRHKGLSAKETSMRPRGQKNGASLKLRQVTDGRQLVQLIYGLDGALKDCEQLHDQASVTSFLTSFDDALSAKGNVTALTHLSRELRWLNMHKLRVACHRNQRLLSKMASRRTSRDDTSSHKRRHRADNFLQRSGVLVAPGTKWCGHSDTAESVMSLGAFGATDRCCRSHDLCPTNVPGLGQKFNFFNYRPFTLSHCSCDARRIGALDLQVPGTKWCGKGSSAAEWSDLGGLEAADRCCRLHDTSCPHHVAAFHSRYGLFNWRPATLMHCSCDARFRACLKMANTGTANLVGKLFFNVVQTKCFILKPEVVCVKRSWWGKCVKSERRKQAHMRDNPPY